MWFKKKKTPGFVNICQHDYKIRIIAIIIIITATTTISFLTY